MPTQTTQWQVKLQGTTLANPVGTGYVGPLNANGLIAANVGPLYWDVIQADPVAFPLAAGKANSVFWPVGPDYAQAFVLMRWSDLQQVQKYSTLPVWGTDLYWSFSIVITVNSDDDRDPGANVVEVKQFWFKEAIRVDKGGPQNDNSVYLVEFVDDAYSVNQGGVWGVLVGNYTQYNMRQVAASLDSGNTSGWHYYYDNSDDAWYDTQSLYQTGDGYYHRYAWESGVGPPDEYQDGYENNSANLGGIFATVWEYMEPGESISSQFNGAYPQQLTDNIQLPYNGGNNSAAWPGLPYFPVGYPQNICWTGRKIWTAMHDVLIHRLGCTMVKRHFETYRWDCVLLGSTQPGLAELEQQNASNIATSTNTIINPMLTFGGSYNVVHARQTRMAGDFTMDSEIGTCKRLSEPAEIVSSEQVAGFLNRTIQSDMPGFWFGSANSSTVIDGTGVTLQQSADDFAEHQDLMWQAPANKTTYIGAVPFTPGSQVKAVTWHNYGDGMFTTVLKYPGPPRNLRDHTGQINMTCEWANYESFAPLNARRGITLIPDLCQIVKLTSGTATGDNYYTAQIVSAPSPVDCYAWCDQTCDHLVSGSYYFARFYGSYNSLPALAIQDIPGMSCTSIVTSVSGVDSSHVTTAKVWLPDRCSDE